MLPTLLVRFVIHTSGVLVNFSPAETNRHCFNHPQHIFVSHSLCILFKEVRELSLCEADLRGYRNIKKKTSSEDSSVDFC